LSKSINVLDSEVLNTFALAIVRQAIDDWKYLCRGKKEDVDCNFKELTYFFQHDCEQYLVGTDISADRIYQALLLKRYKAKGNKKKVEVGA